MIFDQNPTIGLATVCMYCCCVYVVRNCEVVMVSVPNSGESHDHWQVRGKQYP